MSDKERLTMHGFLGGVIGAALMLALICAGQLLDAKDRARENDQLRLSAIKSGFEEGLDRMQCLGGVRYDVATGALVDLHEELLVRRESNAD